MNVTYLDYDTVTKFLKKIYSKLKVFHLTIRSDGLIYLLSNLWERLTLQHFSKLEEFYLKYFEYTGYEKRYGDYL